MPTATVTVTVTVHPGFQPERLGAPGPGPGPQESGGGCCQAVGGGRRGLGPALSSDLDSRGPSRPGPAGPAPAAAGSLHLQGHDGDSASRAHSQLEVDS